MSILTVGTMAFDSIETPYGKVDKVIGGACTYISWAASYWHKDIPLVSIIGDDFPQDEVEQLKARGVNMEGLVRVPNKKSFNWSGKYHKDMNGRDTLVTDLNVLADFNPILPQSYRKCKCHAWQSYTRYPIICFKSNGRTAKTCRLRYDEFLDGYCIRAFDGSDCQSRCIDDQ